MKIMKKLVVSTPPPALVNAYLREIAKGYKLDWTSPEPSDDDAGGGLKVRVACMFTR